MGLFLQSHKAQILSSYSCIFPFGNSLQDCTLSWNVPGEVNHRMLPRETTKYKDWSSNEHEVMWKMPWAIAPLNSLQFVGQNNYEIAWLGRKMNSLSTKNRKSTELYFWFDNNNKRKWPYLQHNIQTIPCRSWHITKMLDFTVRYFYNENQNYLQCAKLNVSLFVELS